MIYFSLLIIFLIWLHYLSPLLITYKLAHPAAKTPSKAYHKAACFDVYAVEDTTVPSGGWKEINIGVAFAAWPHIYFSRLGVTFTPLGNIAAKIHTRSGLAKKKGLRAHLGIIDNDYRNAWTVLMFNGYEFPVRFHAGDRVAQIEFYRVPSTYLFKKDKLSNSLRGTNGFGSTGK